MMAYFDASANEEGVNKMSPSSQSPINGQPPIGETPVQLLAQQAAEGRRGAAWRLLHLIMEGDPHAIAVATSLDDDRLAHNLLESLALSTWAGKPFVPPLAVRTAHAKTRLITLFLPASGMESARAMRILLVAVHDKRSAMREAAIHILGIMGNHSVIPLLLDALNDPVHSTRLEAVKALGRIGDASVVPALLHALHSADEQMGSQIFLALMELGSLAVPALIAESNSDSAWIRWHCIRALGQICDDRALPVIVHALADQDHAVAWVAAKELPNFGKMSVEPVLRLLVTEDTSAWLVETTSYVLKDQCQRHEELRPYLGPVLKEMHSVGYRLKTPSSALKALEALEASGLTS
jgi:HEAT repeat protein